MIEPESRKHGEETGARAQADVMDGISVSPARRVDRCQKPAMR